MIVSDSEVDADGEALLVAAERDVDLHVGAYSKEDNGLKFGRPNGVNEKGLMLAQRIALRRATCAQAEYRYLKGPEWFAEDQYASVSGPDFSTRGIKRRFGPKAREELAESGLMRRGGKAVI